MFDIEQVNQNSIFIRFASSPSRSVTQKIQTCAEYIKRKLESSLLDAIPSYTTLLIVIDTDHVSVSSVYKSLLLWKDASEIASNESAAEHRIEIPVCYDVRVAPDLLEVSAQAALCVDELIEIHSKKTYTVFALGFLPGFAFLGELDERLILPRRSTPRTAVSKGSVGIAGRQTGIYPMDSPGGWNVIGHTPKEILTFDAITGDRDVSSPFAVGMEVSFRPISFEEHHKLSQQGSGNVT